MQTTLRIYFMRKGLRMKEKNTAYIIANFGGPRTLDEIEPFLSSLLCDKDVLRTPLPQFLHSLLFRWIAKRRAPKVRPEYEHMGGGSPIYQSTEAVAERLKAKGYSPILTFHRYLPATHQDFIQQVTALKVDEIRVFPMFPQFTYATTGSIARWFQKNLPKKTVSQLRWLKSYPSYPSFAAAYAALIREKIEGIGLKPEETILLFSAHGIPRKFVDTGDVYTKECEDSFHAVMSHFPGYLGKLSYQSKFGPGEWVRPYTIDVCEEIQSWCEGRKHVVFVPISFTSDHIETLCEIENDYMTVIREKGLEAHRVPALNLLPEWTEAIADLLEEDFLTSNQMLLYK